jgi:hypothetical protein
MGFQAPDGRRKRQEFRQGCPALAREWGSKKTYLGAGSRGILKEEPVGALPALNGRVLWLPDGYAGYR